MPKVPAQVVHANYQLKSSFFYEKLRSLGYFEIFGKLKKVIEDQGNAYTWEKHLEWGISEKSWGKVEEAEVNPLLVFCHPKILKINPSFLRYYRSVSMLPIKGLKTIAQFSNVERVEEKGIKIPDNKVMFVVNAINQISSFVVEMSSDFDEKQIQAMIHATAGSYIEGSWRNKIGAEGERVVRTVLLKALYRNKELISYLDKNDCSTLIDSNVSEEDLVKNVPNIKSVTTVNNQAIYFSSEPDIEFIDSEGQTVGAVEIKAGLDPAGALERLGAMFKSFDNILSKQPDAETILVASCITDEVQSRLSDANSVSATFILNELINNTRGRRDRFVTRIRRILGLTSQKSM